MQESAHDPVGGTALTPVYVAVARVETWVSLNPAGAMGVILEVGTSTNGGTTWTNPDGGPGFARAGASLSGEWIKGYKDAVFDLSVGTTYMFGVRVSRESGAADATESRCTVNAEILNRNGASTPLGTTGGRDGRR